MDYLKLASNHEIMGLIEALLHDVYACSSACLVRPEQNQSNNKPNLQPLREALKKHCFMEEASLQDEELFNQVVRGTHRALLAGDKISAHRS